ncbi:MAG: urea ABC transporter ATP-binding protein UrtD [Rhodospirillales bacterium 20-60-12]|nr:MAG: urea ABC transporter ATP-binding protein UrtD [Rhodospirillales bacterium 20-60-12]HQT67077.1 urea ABC transporter ATP-binding protein UrtD [Acetobacteraceae bacterium]
MNAIPAPILMVENVTVDFDGFKALTNVSLSVTPGTLRILIGPNGAGKSTFCDTVIGRVRPSEGRIMFKNEDITRLPEQEIVKRGICRKFQTPGVLPTLTVLDNLLVAGRPNRNWWRAFGTGATRAEAERAREILDMIGLDDRAGVMAADLAHGEKQWLEIGMVVATDADLLLLDEPTAGMGPQDTARTAALILKLLGRHAVLVIDHDMAFVEALDGPVTVLHMGQILKEGSVAEIRADAQVTAVYLGRSEDDEAAAA